MVTTELGRQCCSSLNLSCYTRMQWLLIVYMLTSLIVISMHVSFCMLTSARVIVRLSVSMLEGYLMKEEIQRNVFYLYYACQLSITLHF